MQLFAKLSPTYKGELENVDLNTIIAEHIDHNLDQMTVQPEHRKNFNKFKDVSRFKEIVSTNAQTAFQQSPFKCTTWKFWKGYLFLALYLSVLMFILSSVKLVDFGWALLTGSLTAISYAIINGLSFMDFVRPDGFVEFFNLILLSIYVCIYLWIMFSKRIKNGVKKAFGIAFQFFIPHVIYAYFGLFDEIHDCPYPRMDYNIDPCEGYEYFGRESYYMVAMAVCLLAVAIGIWFFNRYYTRRYVYPDPSR